VAALLLPSGDCGLRTSRWHASLLGKPGAASVSLKLMHPTRALLVAVAVDGIGKSLRGQPNVSVKCEV
jgi:hypothetical protein